MNRRTIIELVSTAIITAIAGVAAASETVTYSYDALGRLVKTQHAGSINNNVISNYVYDPAGSRNQVQVTGAP